MRRARWRRSLPTPSSARSQSLTRRNIVKLRDRYERIFCAILEQGAADGSFRVHDVKVETYALMALATAVAGWYRPRGRLSVDAVAEIYASLVLDGVRARDSA